MMKIAIRLIALTLLIQLSVVHVTGAETFPLVDGDRQAVIVGDAVVKGGGYAGPANFLQHYVAQSTGRTLKSVSEKEYDPATMPFPRSTCATRIEPRRRHFRRKA